MLGILSNMTAGRLMPGPSSPYAPAAREGGFDHRRAFERGLGGGGGLLMSLGDVLSQMALATATPSYGGVGESLARGLAADVGGSIGRAREAADRVELDEYIEGELANPDLPDDERRLLEAFGSGGSDLAALQVRQQAIQERRAERLASAGPKPLSREALRNEQERRGRWAVIADRGLATFDITTMNTQGSILNTALKRFHDEPERDFRLRQQYALEKADLFARLGEGDSDLMARESFNDWTKRKGVTYGGDPSASVADTPATGPAGPIVDDAADDGVTTAGIPLPSFGDLADALDVGPDMRSFVDRVVPDAWVPDLSSVGMIPWDQLVPNVSPSDLIPDFGISDAVARDYMSDLAGPNARQGRDTVSREQELRGGSRLEANQATPTAILDALGGSQGPVTPLLDMLRIGRQGGVQR